MAYVTKENQGIRVNLVFPMPTPDGGVNLQLIDAPECLTKSLVAVLPDEVKNVPDRRNITLEYRESHDYMERRLLESLMRDGRQIAIQHGLLNHENEIVLTRLYFVSMFSISSPTFESGSREETRMTVCGYITHSQDRMPLTPEQQKQMAEQQAAAQQPPAQPPSEMKVEEAPPVASEEPQPAPIVAQDGTAAQ